MSLSVRIESVQGFALKLSQPACLLRYDPKNLERVLLVWGLISVTEKEMLTELFGDQINRKRRWQNPGIKVSTCYTFCIFPSHRSLAGNNLEGSSSWRLSELLPDRILCRSHSLCSISLQCIILA